MSTPNNAAINGGTGGFVPFKTGFAPSPANVSFEIGRFGIEGFEHPLPIRVSDSNPKVFYLGISPNDYQIVSLTNGNAFITEDFTKHSLKTPADVEAIGRLVSAHFAGIVPAMPTESLWSAPQPLVKPIPIEPYPIDALPPLMHQLATEINDYNGAPMGIIGTCMLSALSLALQSQFNVARDSVLIGPISLYSLVVATTNERKSSVDDLVLDGIRKWERKACANAKSLLAQHEVEMSEYQTILEQKQTQLLAAIHSGEETESIKAAIADLKAHPPSEPMQPNMFHNSVTPESLIFELSQYPSGCIASAEAGVIFGGNLFRKENAMLSMSFFNQLWSGEAAGFKVSRRTSKNFELPNCRFTLGLQVQATTLRDFIRSSGMTRGGGFMARFLITEPETTQGYRDYQRPIPDWVNLRLFNDRVIELIDRPLRLNEGGLDPIVLRLSTEASDLWIDFYNDIEHKLRADGKYSMIRDVAGKAAENIARVAALFECWKTNYPAEVSVESVLNAAILVKWHLDEAIRFFHGIEDDSHSNRDDIRLDTWLRLQGEAVLSKRHIHRHGPIRDGARLDAALNDLVDLDRVKIEKKDKKITVLINPSLISDRAT